MLKKDLPTQDVCLIIYSNYMKNKRAYNIKLSLIQVFSVYLKLYHHPEIFYFFIKFNQVFHMKILLNQKQTIYDKLLWVSSKI